MNDYIIKLFIGSLCMIVLAAILAGSNRPATVEKKKPIKPEVTYVIENGKIVGAASSVPYSEDGVIEQQPVEESILEDNNHD